jgi:hypothetical protein
MWVVDFVAGELHDQTELALTQEWFHVSHDPRTPTDHDPFADLKGVFAAHVAGRDDVVTTAQLVAIVRQERSHLNV